MGPIKDRSGMDLTEAEDNKKRWQEYTDQIRSVAQSCPTLCNPMNCSTPGLQLDIHMQKNEFGSLPYIIYKNTFKEMRN